MKLTWGIHMGKNSWKTYEMFHGFSNLHGKLVELSFHEITMESSYGQKLMENL